jgi:hypothetical protein
MNEKYSYHELTVREENRYERWLAELTMKVFCPRLDLRQIGLNFISQSQFGAHIFDAPIVGFCPANGREIFVRNRLDDRDLVLAVVHELRHCWQRQTRKHCMSKDSMERDCRIYERQNDPPKTPKEIRRWLLLEEAFDKDPTLRRDYDHIDRLMRERKVTERETPTGNQSSVVRRERGREYAVLERQVR